MTREEAIKYLTNDWFKMRSGQVCVEYDHSDRFLEAVGMAIAALRAQESGSCKNCTDHTDGCEYCREAENIYYHAGKVNALDELLYITGDDLVVDIGCRFYLAASVKFCPMCGRRLEEV